jgi:hypothetical protein
LWISFFLHFSFLCFPKIYGQKNLQNYTSSAVGTVAGTYPPRC